MGQEAGLAKQGGEEGRGEKRMDFEYVPEVVIPLFGLSAEEGNGSPPITLSPCPDALVLAGGRKRACVLLEKGLGWVQAQVLPPTPTPRPPPPPPLRATVTGKKRKW